MNLKLKFEIIKKLGSQARFSQLIGLDESAVSRVIHGLRLLSEEEKVKWAEVLGCDPLDLFPPNVSL